MLSPNLPNRLDEMGFLAEAFESVRDRYYRVLSIFIEQDRHDEAIDLIKLAVGIDDFDRIAQPLEVIQNHLYSGEGPFCAELRYSQVSGAREIAQAVYDNPPSKLDEDTRRIGNTICVQCISWGDCDVRVE